MATPLRAYRWLIAAALAAGVIARLSVLAWNEPWTPHHWDEHVLQLEALALWEGVTPREVGWPASTTRMMLSGLAAVQWARSGAAEAWALRDHPGEALESISAWIGERFVDPELLYRPGRALSIFTGVAQLLALLWALRRWVGPAGVVAGLAAGALSPVAVEYSQYVLADITALFFATIVVGLAARPTERNVLRMAAFAALATASKFHFGLWLLAPMLSVWLGLAGTMKRRLSWSLLTVSVFAVVLLAAVPWIWLNPVLTLKEFLGVVGSKVGSGATFALALSNIPTILIPTGALALVGSVLALAGGRARANGPLLVVVIPTVLGFVGVTASAVVFHRYGLVFLPGLLLLAATGWDLALTQSSTSLRTAARAVLIAALAGTGAMVVWSQRWIGEADVDVQVRAWILHNVPRGSRVAIHQEANAFLPRSTDDLRRCVTYVNTPEAFDAKWRVEGLPLNWGTVAPMRLIVMNDQLFQAYWCDRELQVQRDQGYNIVAYHAERRFHAVLERDAIREFREGTRDITGGLDVLVVNRAVDAGREPVLRVRTTRGERLVYRR